MPPRFTTRQETGNVASPGEHDVDVVLAGDVPDRLAELAGFLDPGVVFRRADLGHLTPTGKILAVRVWSGRQESWAAPGPASAMRRCRRRRPVVDHRQLTPGLRQRLSNRARQPIDGAPRRLKSNGPAARLVGFPTRRYMIQVGKGGVFAMGQAVPTRTDYTAGEVRRFAKRAKDGAQARRLLALAAVLDGVSRKEAARLGGMDRQT